MVLILDDILVIVVSLQLTSSKLHHNDLNFYHWAGYPVSYRIFGRISGIRPSTKAGSVETFSGGGGLHLLTPVILPLIRHCERSEMNAVYENEMFLKSSFPVKDRKKKEINENILGFILDGNSEHVAHI